jgi:hypothetical protein
MPIQIEQKMPRCARCGKLVHDRDLDRVESGGVLFCSTTCHDEFLELKAHADARETEPSATASERG